MGSFKRALAGVSALAVAGSMFASTGAVVAQEEETMARNFDECLVGVRWSIRRSTSVRPKRRM